MDIKNKEPVAAKLLSEKLKKYGAEERVQVGSFHQKQINLFRTYSNAPTSAGPIETYKFIKSAKKWIKSKSKFTEKTYNFISLTIPMGIPPSSFSPKWKLVSPEIIKFAHKSNIAVFVWTINEGEHIKTLLEWNVDGIFTDKPRLMMDILKSTD